MTHIITTLLEAPTVIVRDAVCDGAGAHEASADVTHLVLPYRGVFVRRHGEDDVVAEPNQVLFANAGETYTYNHPVAGGDASLLLVVDLDLLREIAPPAIVREGKPFAFNRQRMRIDPRAQALVAMLRYSLREGLADTLEGESLALTLAQRAFGPRTAHASGVNFGQDKLVDRAKLVLTGDLARRWTLAEIAAEVGVSPVYLTQVFRRVEGVPLYRYQLRLRLARALDLLGDYEDLSALSHDLGFSSHSHFSEAFRQAYGRSPTEFRQSALKSDR